MKKKLFFLLLILSLNTFAQSITWIPSPANSGLDGTDQAMVPILKKDNFLYCYTTKVINGTQRYQLARVNLDNNEVFVFTSSAMASSTYFFARPRNLMFYQNSIYFNCGTSLFKLDLTTNITTSEASYCENFYIFKNYLFYNYNSSKTYVKNLTTGVASEFKIETGNTIDVYDMGGFYEYNNQLYFLANYRRIEKLTDPAVSTNVYTAPHTPISVSMFIHNVTKINDNLVYLLVANNTFKFASVSLTSNTANTGFLFDALTSYNSQVRLPFVLNGNIYMTNTNGLHLSNGTNAPALTNIPFISSYPLVYNNEAYDIVYSSAYGGEVWKTDGTVAGTSLLKDINPGSEGISRWSPIVFNNTIYSVKVNNNNPGNWDLNIYTSDGTSANTIPILPDNTFTEINQYGAPMIGYNNHLYIHAETATQKGLFKISTTPFQLGTVENFKEGKSIYPNPATSRFYLSDTAQKVEVYDVKGSLILKKNNAKEINIENLVRGVYFVKIYIKEGKNYTEKLIVK